MEGQRRRSIYGPPHLHSPGDPSGASAPALPQKGQSTTRGLAKGPPTWGRLRPFTSIEALLRVIPRDRATADTDFPAATCFRNSTTTLSGIFGRRPIAVSYCLDSITASPCERVQRASIRRSLADDCLQSQAQRGDGRLMQRACTFVVPPVREDEPIRWTCRVEAPIGLLPNFFNPRVG
jgi:hypothetical protein